MSGFVLAIDDSPEILAVLTARLKPMGLDVRTTTDGQTGLALAIEHQPELILLDVCMPEQSGLDICRRLKSDPRTAWIPVIFLTARDDVDTKVHGFDLGATDYILKPFHPDELRARVRNAIRTSRQQQSLHRQARIDALTGLHNRAAFDEILARQLSTAQLEDRDLSLILLDLDHFKAINDGHGHAFGDLVLKHVGHILLTNARPMDYACRFGGEELALILIDTAASAALEIAERLRHQVRSSGLRNEGAAVTITASFGVVSRKGWRKEDTGELDPAALFLAADRALYTAKRDGRDCVRGVLRRVQSSIFPRVVSTALDATGRPNR